MLNTILGIAFVDSAPTALVWRTFGDVRAVAEGVKPRAAGPCGIGMASSDYSGIVGGGASGAKGSGNGAQA